MIDELSGQHEMEIFLDRENYLNRSWGDGDDERLLKARNEIRRLEHNLVKEKTLRCEFTGRFLSRGI